MITLARCNFNQVVPQFFIFVSEESHLADLHVSQFYSTTIWKRGAVLVFVQFLTIIHRNWRHYPSIGATAAFHDADQVLEHGGTLPDLREWRPVVMIFDLQERQ